MRNRTLENRGWNGSSTGRHEDERTSLVEADTMLPLVAAILAWIPIESVGI